METYHVFQPTQQLNAVWRICPLFQECGDDHERGHFGPLDDLDCILGSWDHRRYCGIVVGRGREHRHTLEGSNGISELYIYAEGMEWRERCCTDPDVFGQVHVFQNGR